MTRRVLTALPVYNEERHIPEVLPEVIRYSRDVLWLDAVGLAFFAVAGAEKALVHGIHPVMGALLGMVSGSVGGSSDLRISSLR